MAILAKVSSRLSAVLKRFALLATMLVVDSASAFELHVNSTADAIDANPGDAICASPTGECTLRAAVQEANSLPGLDKVIVGPGHYQLAISGAGEDDSATGDLDVRESILISGAGMGTTVIDAAGLDRVFDVVVLGSFNNALAVDQVTIQGGQGGGVRIAGASNTPSIFERVEIRENEGNAIYAEEATIQIIDSSIVHNGTGAALGTFDGSILVRGSTIAENGGGAIWKSSGGFRGTVLLLDSVVRDNAGSAGYFHEGGADIRDSVIERNGTGFFLGNDTYMTIDSSAIRDNSGPGVTAGAAYATATVTNSVVSGNRGSGLIAACEGELNVSNTTISGNVASVGGGILLDNAFCDVGTYFVGTNLTITGNSADEGGGVAIRGGAFLTSYFRIQNSIIAANQASANQDCALTGNGQLTSQGFNLVGSGEGCAWPLVASDIVGSDAMPIDPLLGPLSDHGGNTFTHSLLPGSLAIDTVPSCTPSDQRGVARPQGLACDRGAFESNACANGIDDDGDGLIDSPADLGCRDALATRERAQCQDGLDNDTDGMIDFDGGASSNGGVAIGSPDPHCAGKPSRNLEAVSCGLGVELLALLAALMAGGRRLRSRRC